MKDFEFLLNLRFCMLDVTKKLEYIFLSFSICLCCHCLCHHHCCVPYHSHHKQQKQTLKPLKYPIYKNVIHHLFKKVLLKGFLRTYDISQILTILNTIYFCESWIYHVRLDFTAFHLTYGGHKISEHVRKVVLIPKQTETDCHLELTPTAIATNQNKKIIKKRKKENLHNKNPSMSRGMLIIALEVNLVKHFFLWNPI